MAAEQRPGRWCSCGCGAPIDHLRPNARRLPGCAWALMLEQKRKRNVEQTGRRKSPARMKNRLPATLVETDANRRQKPCKVCAGMPWARTPDRITEGRDGYQARVCGDNGLCVGCGEGYAPEPAPDRVEVLRSSGGMVAAHGTLHGFDIARPGEGVKAGVLIRGKR
jgi:hypothetical protein